VAHFDAKGLAGQAFERDRVTRRRPELELGVSRSSQLQQIIVAAIVELEAGDRLCVAAVETLCQTKNRRQRPHRAPRAAPQITEAVVTPFRRRLAMVACDQGNRLDFVRFEAAQVAVLHQVIRVLVVAFVADVHPDVVQNRGILEPVALAIGEAVNRARLIEQRHRQPRDLLRVFRPVVAALGKLEHTAPPDVGVAIGLRDLLAVSCDVIEDQTLAQRQVAERELLRAEPLQHFIEQDRAGHCQVGAARFEAGHAQALLEVERHQLLAHRV
jgi:hypothetical protein